MNLSAILSIQDQIQTLSEKRDQRSFTHCKTGFALLLEAEHGDFKDKALLLQACDAFASGISQNHQSADPYFGMGYLLFLLQDYPASNRYLLQVLDIEPHHADTQMLLAQIQNLLRPASMRPPTGHRSSTHMLVNESPAGPSLRTSHDYDQLYDNIEKRVHAQVHTFMNAQRPLTIASTRAVEVQNLQSFINTQQNTLNQLWEQLEIVDQEIDTHELRRKLETAERLIQPYRDTLNQSQALCKIKTDLTRIKKGLGALQMQIEAAQNREQLNSLDRSLEGVLDRCDEIADRLDEQAQENPSVLAMVESYETLVAEVDKLNDIFDDALAQF